MISVRQRRPRTGGSGRKNLSIAEDLLEQGTTSMHALVSRCRVTKLPQDHFARVPGKLQSFRDLDTAEEYRDAVSGPDILP